MSMEESSHVVIIEDEEAHFQLMKRAIHKEFPFATLHHFYDAVSCLEKVDAIAPDAIVADYLMPGMNGIEFLEALRKGGKDIPVIIITGQGDENIAVQAMKLGAWDYLVKSADFFLLLPSTVERVVRERKLKESLCEISRLNELLLDSLPHPAMLIRRNRTIVSANRLAQEGGARVGGFCWREYGHSAFIPEEHKRYIEDHEGAAPPGGTKCTFCLADEAMEANRPANAPEVNAFDRLWDVWWIPLDLNTYLHYAVDITARKLAEQHIHWLTHQLMKAQENERQRLSRNLHDLVGQELSTLKIGIDTLLDDHPANDQQLEQKIGRLSRMLQGTIMSVRDLAYNLRPATLDQLGLVRTVQQHCEDFSARHGIGIDFMAAGMEDLQLDFDTEIILYRLIQEGLRNIKNHAEAENVTIRLVASFPNIILRIEDDGIGFDVQNRLISAFQERRMGLRSMQERVALLGGSMRIQSRPRMGTRIRIEVPYKERSGE